MPRKKAQATPEVVVKQGTLDGTVVPRFQLGELGYTGLKISNGLIYEDQKRELQFPQCVQVYKQMTYDPTIASALMFYDLLFTSSVWKVRAPEKATAIEKQRTQFVQECMNDMEHTWRDFIQEAGSMVPYGFSVHEKVYRKRTQASGSKYNDGLIGWRKLPVRSQDTISKWIYSDDGRELKGVEQDLNLVNNFERFHRVSLGGEIVIPRSKFMLFRTGKRRENPFGESVLKSVYIPWKYRCAIEETEGIGVQRDLSGLPVVYIPPQYLSADASPEQQAIAEYYKNVIRNIHVNQQAGLVMPMAYDPDTKQPLFKFDLIGSEGRKNFDTSEIIRRYDNKILTTLGADILILGQAQTGSYNLGSIKQSLVSMSMESRLQEIADQINNDLIPQTFKLNGWDAVRTPEVYFDDFSEDAVEEFSKLIQRAASVGLIERDRPILNKVRRAIGVDPLPDDAPVREELLTGNTSRAGDGMEKGSGNGTSDSVAGSDNSVQNLDNNA